MPVWFSLAEVDMPPGRSGVAMHGSGQDGTPATPEEQREREIGALRRAIEGAEFHLFELSTIPNQEGLEPQYALYKDEKRLALRKLKELRAKRR